MSETITLDIVETLIPGLTPWQPLRSGYDSVDAMVPSSLLGNAVQLRVSRSAAEATADSYRLALDNALDGTVLYLHTSGKSDAIATKMGLRVPSGRKVARNIQLKKVTSLEKVAKFVYKSIASALRRKENLPRLFILTGVSNHELIDRFDVESEVPKLLEFLAAVSEYDLVRMDELSGISYSEVVDEAAPDLGGVCMGVVVYHTPQDIAPLGKSDTLPSLDQIEDEWLNGPSSILVMEKLEDVSPDVSVNARITFLKRTFVSAKKAPVAVPMCYSTESGWETPA